MIHSGPPEKPFCLNSPGSYLPICGSLLTISSLSSSIHPLLARSYGPSFICGVSYLRWGFIAVKRYHDGGNSYKQKHFIGAAIQLIIIMVETMVTHRQTWRWRGN